MTASDEHLDGLIAAFALDAVDDTERRLVEKHLKGCAQCREELRTFSEAAVHLTDGLEEAPPQALRASVLDAVAGQSQPAVPAHTPDGTSDRGGAATSPGDTMRAGATDGEHRLSARRGTKAWWGLAAAGLLAVGGWGIWQGLEEDLSPTQEVVQADDAERYETEYRGSPVTVVASESLDRAVLVTDELPELAAGEVYQGWWIDDGGTITSAGVLDGADGAADVQTTLQGEVDTQSSFALSVEPSGGSEQPTTDPVLVLPLQS